MSTPDQQGISVHVDHNPHLAEGAGTVDAIVSIAAPADFAATGGPIPDLTLRLWMPVGARAVFVKQVAPTVEDLTHCRADAGNQCGEYPLGSWGSEERDYHIQVEIEPAPVGREKLAARVSVVAGEQTLGEGLVTAVWTADSALSARISRRVAHYTGQAELAQAVQEGLSARKAGDVLTATAKLGRAMELAVKSGNNGTARLLRGVVEVDENTGTARLRPGSRRQTRWTSMGDPREPPESERSTDAHLPRRTCVGVRRLLRYVWLTGQNRRSATDSLTEDRGVGVRFMQGADQRTVL